MRATNDGDAWLTTDEVARRLQLKRSTVYAYVSRGLLTPERSGRESRFLLSEVESLAAERHPGRSAVAAAPGRIFEIVEGVPTYRGTSALDLARSRTFEEVADLLWAEEPSERVWPEPAAHGASMVRSAIAALPSEVMVSDRLKVAVAVLGAVDGPGSSYYLPEVIDSSKRLLVTAVHGLPRADGQDLAVEEESGRPLARRLWDRLTSRDPAHDEVMLLDAALVLAAEHGMAPSTTVARTAASLGATIYGVVGAGLGAGTNDVLGSSALIVEDMLRQIRGAPQSLRGLVELARIQGYLAGFGHRAHPEGDARAAYLLERLHRVAGDADPCREVRELRDVMTERGLPPPNLYYALASLVHCFGMARGSTEAVFAVGRSAGWIAHALDEYVRNGRRRSASS